MTTVPLAGAAAVSVIVHVAESPLPPEITFGLQVKALAVCALELELLIRDAVKATAIAIEDRVECVAACKTFTNTS